MGEADELNNMEGRIRRLEARLDDFMELFKDPQELSASRKEDWYREVIQKTRRLVDDYPAMLPEQKERFEVLIARLRALRPAIHERSLVYSEIFDRLEFADGILTIHPLTDIPAILLIPDKLALPSFDLRFSANLTECLGFEVENDHEYFDLVNQAVNADESLLTKHGGYVRWHFGNGIELWSQLDASHKTVDMFPHYAGKTAQIIGISGSYPDPYNPMQGLFQGWVNPRPDHLNEPLSIYGEYPFIFHCPTFDWFSGLTPMCIARVELSAFAINIEIVSPEHTVQPGSADRLQLDEEFFIPTGTFPIEEREMPLPIAMFGGEVLECQTLDNTVSGGTFILANIRTFGMDIDTVIAGHSLPRPLQKGDWVRGEFWLSGQIIELLDTFDRSLSIDREQLIAEVDLAGVYYYQAEEVIDQLGFGDPLILRREPDNPHDAKAIAVYSADLVKLGYIPREKNELPARLLDEGKQLPAHVVGKSGEPYREITIRLYYPHERDNFYNFLDGTDT